MTGQRDWRRAAACRDVDPEWFFPTATTGPEYDAAVERAKWVCAGCSVRAECLTDALARIPDGIAGGLTEDERRAIRRSRQTAASVDGQRPAAVCGGTPTRRSSAREGRPAASRPAARAGRTGGSQVRAEVS